MQAYSWDSIPLHWFIGGAKHVDWDSGQRISQLSGPFVGNRSWSKILARHHCHAKPFECVRKMVVIVFEVSSLELYGNLRGSIMGTALDLKR